MENPDWEVFELAAGSFRDVGHLLSKRINCQGGDFSRKCVQKAQENWPQWRERFSVKDAFYTGFPDNAFDLTYHNGFWVLFEDTDLEKLIREQARITRNVMVATVHNGHNAQFKRYFRDRSEKDELFDVRFFEENELTDLMAPYCREIEVVSVGKRKKYHEDFLIRAGLTNPKLLRWYMRNVSGRMLETSERLMCIGRL